MLIFNSIDILSTIYRTKSLITTSVDKNSIDILSTGYRTKPILGVHII